MEPFEWLILGAGLLVGSLLGARGKDVARVASKGYLTIEEKARQAQERMKHVSANVREDFRDAIEEARFERDQDTHSRANSASELNHARTDNAVRRTSRKQQVKRVAEPAVTPKPAPRKKATAPKVAAQSPAARVDHDSSRSTTQETT